jgi:hypothetical protein
VSGAIGGAATGNTLNGFMIGATTGFFAGLGGGMASMAAPYVQGMISSIFGLSSNMLAQGLFNGKVDIGQSFIGSAFSFGGSIFAGSLSKSFSSFSKDFAVGLSTMSSELTVSFGYDNFRNGSMNKFDSSLGSSFSNSGACRDYSFRNDRSSGRIDFNDLNPYSN